MAWSLEIDPPNHPPFLALGEKRIFEAPAILLSAIGYFRHACSLEREIGRQNGLIIGRYKGRKNLIRHGHRFGMARGSDRSQSQLLSRRRGLIFDLFYSRLEETARCLHELLGILERQLDPLVMGYEHPRIVL